MEFISNHWEGLLIPVSAIITWFLKDRLFQKKDLKQKDLELDSSSSEIVSKNLEIYQRMLDDVDERYKIQLKNRDLEIQLLTKENAELKIQVGDLTNKVEELVKQVKRLDDKIKKDARN